MITRKEYRNRMQSSKESRKGKVLTDEEFYALPLSKRYAYANMQKSLGKPVTVEQDTEYDEKVTSDYKPVKVSSSSKVTQHKILGFMAVLAKFDIILGYCGLTK